jgi:hypothetical protein
MRRLAAALLALLPGAALGDWTAVGRSNEIYAAYADTATIRRAGGVATMHGLYDFRRQDFTPEGRGLYSTAVLREYDCEGRRVRLMSSVDFAGHMGQGAAVSSSSAPRRWEAVAEGGIDDAFWQIACSAR